ncbi:MAG: ThiF family adenylyltransferase [Candidatus Thermoplasmatota archaeon]|nr:ThiF family adenylyltransferase [Candidatus Thermoplasmatota archaeon]
MTAERMPRILIVGAGGIGGLAFDLIVPALEKVGEKCSITIMDGDTVEASNLGHQRFSSSDIGSFKTAALVQKYESLKNVYCVSDTENLRVKEQLQEFDYIIIGVDRPHPRRLVHATDVPWIDLRSTGDGHVYFTNDSDPALVAMMTPDHEPASCQIAGAIAAGNIQFGYVNAAAAAATWLMGQLRNQPPLRERMSSIMFGELKFPEVKA